MLHTIAYISVINVNVSRRSRGFTFPHTPTAARGSTPSASPFPLPPAFSAFSAVITTVSTNNPNAMPIVVFSAVNGAWSRQAGGTRPELSNCSTFSCVYRDCKYGGRPGLAALPTCTITCSMLTVHTTNCAARFMPPAKEPPLMAVTMRMAVAITRNNPKAAPAKASGGSTSSSPPWLLGHGVQAPVSFG